MTNITAQARDSCMIGTGIISQCPWHLRTFHQGKQHSVVCLISVPCQALEKVVQGPLQDKESFLH